MFKSVSFASLAEQSVPRVEAWAPIVTLNALDLTLQGQLAQWDSESQNVLATSGKFSHSNDSSSIANPGIHFCNSVLGMPTKISSHLSATAYANKSMIFETHVISGITDFPAEISQEYFRLPFSLRVHIDRHVQGPSFFLCV